MTERPATDAEVREIFGTSGQIFDEQYAEEAEQRWGDTEAWAQSQERTARLSAADWQRVKTEADELEADLAAAVRAGTDPTGEQAMDLAERHRRSIETFYDCAPDFHRNLGDLFVSDARYRDRFEALAPGLAAWLRAAVHANADRRD